MRKKPGSTSGDPDAELLDLFPQRLGPALQGELGGPVGAAEPPETMPAVEVMVTMWPDRCRRMTGRTARVTFSGPKKFVSICARNCSGLISSKYPAWKFPALLTRTSMRPNRSIAARTADVDRAVSVMSSRDGQEVVVLADRRDDVRRPHVRWRRRDPGGECRLAMSTPMPRPAPVMSQTLVSVISCLR